MLSGERGKYVTFSYGAEFSKGRNGKRLFLKWISRGSTSPPILPPVRVPVEN